MGHIYGIDLGTTNSLIGRGDTLYSGLVSSSVNVKTKSQVSRDVVSEDVVSSYKVNMTTGNSGQLPIACSSIILRELEGLSYEEIAKLTNTHLGTVKYRISRAREKLQVELAHYL